MLETDKVFAGSIPENYDRYMVPLIFEPYAADIARRAASFSPGAVLETAAGSGVVTRALAPRLPRGASYTVTDLNQPMVDYAASRQPPDTRIKWRQADALALPFDNAAFDLVCCQFGAMFFPDRTSGYREARRVLKPGGHFLFSVWDRIEENVFADDVTNALARIFPNDPPRFLARTPHGYYDTALIRSELGEAGFSRVVIETRAEQSRASSPRLPAVAYCQGTLLRNEIEARDTGNLESATDYVASAIADKHGRGEVAAKIQAHVIVAVVQTLDFPFRHDPDLESAALATREADMQPFTILTAAAAPLEIAKIDTGMILPGRYMRRHRRPGHDYGEAFLYDLRFDEHGRPRQDFVLNMPAYRDARILVTDSDFGCGSSREGAAFAVMDYGLRALVGPSFGEIFQVNCIQNGILAVTLAEATIHDLWRQLRAKPGAEMTIDLPNQVVIAPDGSTHAFDISPLRKDRLVRGIDDIDVTLEYRDAIERFETKRRDALPWLPTARRAGEGSERPARQPDKRR